MYKRPWLPQAGGYALVWCVRPEHSEQLMALSDEAFLQALQQAFGQRVGRFINVGSRSTYPLGLNAQAINTARTLAIGNAAQTLHPVAGQGLNLGLRVFLLHISEPPRLRRKEYVCP